MSSVAHFCCTAELRAGNSCSSGLSEENIQEIFQKGKGAKKGAVRLSRKCNPGALAKMTDGERLMMAILSLKTDEGI